MGIYHLTPGDKPALLPQIEAVGDPRIRLLKQNERFEW